MVVHPARLRDATEHWGRLWFRFRILKIACEEDMPTKRSRISDGATMEELQALLSKAARQLRTTTRPGHDVSIFNQIEAEVEQMRARRKSALV